jgi:hypothetical protein
MEHSSVLPFLAPIYEKNTQDAENRNTLLIDPESLKNDGKETENIKFKQINHENITLKCQTDDKQCTDGISHNSQNR